MRKGFVKKLDWRIDRIEAKYTDVKKDPLTGKNVLPDKIIDTPDNYKIKYQIAEVELVEVSDPVCLHKNKPNEVHKIRALVHIRLVEVKDGKQIADADGVLSVMDCKNHKKRLIEIINDMREESARQATAFSEYLGDKLNQKYAKNQYGEMEFYQNKGKQEYIDEMKRKNTMEDKRKRNQEKLILINPHLLLKLKLQYIIGNERVERERERPLKKERHLMH